MKAFTAARKPALLLSCAGCLLAGSCSQAIRSEGILHADWQTAQAAGPEQTVEVTLASMFALATPLYLYYIEYDRWPSNAGQIEAVARDWEVPLNMSDYSAIEMHESDDGRLHVHFELAPPKRGEGEFMLSKPQMDQRKGNPHDMLM